MARRDDLTPEQHEARIAELRARRRARLAVLARRSAFIGVGLFLLVVVLLAWLLQTVAGRDVLLNQIVSRLPVGTTLTWTSAEGPAAGPLTLRGVHFSMPRQIDPACVPTDTASCEMGRIVFDAQTVVLDPALRPLLGRRLRLDALVVQGATLSLPRSDTPFELPRWPESLPDIAPPLELQADDIRIDDLSIRQDAQPMIAIASARGGLDASDGRLHVEHLVVESDRGRFTAHGDYAPRDDYRSDLTLSAALPAPPLRTAPRVGVVLRGDLSRMLVAVSGHAPAPLEALLVLRDDTRSEQPRWSLRARSEALDPSLLSGSGEASEPLSFDFKAGGIGGRARMQGEFARGDFAVVVQPSRLRLEDQVLELRPLVVDLLDGRVVARGHVDLRRDAPNAAGDESPIRLALQARDLRWIGSTPEVPAIVLDADVGVAGTPDLWAAIGNATFQRGAQQASVRFDGLGNRSDVEVRKLHAATSNGALDATGRLQWAPTLAWNGEATLGGFDPGYFLPDWPGAITGHATTSGETLANGDLALRFDADRLGGRLRGRSLGGHGKLAMLLPADSNAAPRYEGNVDLRLGESRVEASGTIADRLDVRARFEPLRLDDLLPNAGGTLRGTLALAGARNAPDITANLDGSGLRYDDWAVETLHAQGRLPWRSGSGSLVLDATGLDAGIPVSSVHVDASGAVERLQLQATAGSEYGDLALAGSTAHRNGRWQGTLDSLQLDPWRGSAWSLQSPATFAQAGNGWRLDSTCLAAADGGTLCASGDWPRQGLHVEGRGLPLALATPYLPERSDGRPWLLHGEIALDLDVRRSGNSWRGEGSVVSAVGGLKNSARSRNDLVGYRDLVLVAHFDPERIQASVNAGLNGEGRLVGRIDAGWDAYAPLQGEVALDTSELTWMELLSPDIVEPTGTLAGHIALGGTRAQPTLGGNAQLTDFATEIPALAIAPSEGNVRLDALPDGTAHIAGSIKSGDGVLRIDGSLGWSGADTPLVLNVRGENVLASDTRDLRMVVAPDVVVRYAARQPLDIRGSVQVPSARIDLERLDSGVSVSEDVVVLDPEDPEEGLATPMQMDLTIALGEDVRLNGFGLEGSLGGSLRVVARPGREMVATGTLDVGGKYEAYGQELQIARGRLVWQGSPIADPLLDIRAEREVGDVTAGIDVGGRASRPTAEVWTDPATDQSEALAYLALGRPLSTVTGDESRQLDAASAALSAGTGLLASQLGAKIGLDDAGVSQSRALGGSVLGVGKYLSPKLYVGYGVSLLGTGQVLTLKYLLRKGFDIEIESSTIENRASVNWRKER